MPAPTTVPPDRPEGVCTAPPPSLVGSRCLVCQERRSFEVGRLSAPDGAEQGAGVRPGPPGIPKTEPG